MSQKPPQSLTADEVLALLFQLTKDPKSSIHKSKQLRNYCMALLMVDAGMRVSEVANLLIGDLVIAGHPVSQIVIRPEIAKRGRGRSINTTARLKEAISKINSTFWFYLKMSPTDFAFLGQRKSKPISVMQIQRIIANAGKIALQRHIHPHMLRHTFATRLMKVTNARVVQQLLGHRHLSSTQIYTHPDGTDLKMAVDKMDSTG